MTREDLSYNLGLSVRTINRLVQSLRERNALTVRSGKIHITADQLPLLRSTCLIPIRPGRRQITHFDIILDLFLAKKDICPVNLTVCFKIRHFMPIP